jgi:hypothetical protein
LPILVTPEGRLLQTSSIVPRFRFGLIAVRYAQEHLHLPRQLGGMNLKMSNQATWKRIDSAPKDGTPVLLIARFNIQTEENGTVVGHWENAIERWKPVPRFLDNGHELIPTWWMEIPKLPTS